MACQGSCLLIRCNVAAVDGVVPKSTSALAIDQHAFMEARTHFLERFELEHEITGTWQPVGGICMPV
jgi:hypothetical protein